MQVGETLYVANTNYFDPEFNLNALQQCVLDENSSEDEIKRLLDTYDVNHQDVDGCTALHFAIGEERYDLAKLLLEHGANPAIVDKRNETAYDDLINLENPDPLKAELREEMKKLLDTKCIRRGHKSSSEAVQYIVDHALSSANFAGYQDFNDDDLKTLSTIGPSLEKLQIRSLKFKEATLSESLKNFNALQHLDLGWCLQITGESLYGCRNLTTLNLNGCKRIVGTVLVKISKECPTIQSLSVSWTSITNDDIKEILANLKDLRYLNINHCKQLDHNTLSVKDITLL